MTSILQDQEKEGFNRRGYTPDEQISLLTDALYYDPQGKYFHTVDGRFAQVWLLGMLDQTTLNQEQMVTAANQVSRILSEYPYGSSGQMLRYTHRGIGQIIDGFIGEGSAHPFGDAILESMADRQFDAAMNRKGFFSKISPRMIDKAKAALEEDLNNLDRRDVGYQLIEKSTTIGTYPYVSEFYLVFLWEPPKSAIGKVSHYFQRLLAGLNIVDIHSHVKREYVKQRRQFLSLADNIEKTLNASSFSAARLNGQGLMDFLYRLLNPVRSHQTPSPIYRDGYTIGDLLTRQSDVESTRDRETIGAKVGFQPIEPDSLGFKWPFWVGGEKQYYYGRVTSVGGLPAKQEPGLLQNALTNVEGESLISLNFYITPKARVAARLWARQKQVDLAGNVGNSESEVHRRRVTDLEAIKNAVASDNVYNRQRMMDVSIHCSFFGFDATDVEDRAMSAERHLFDEGIHETVRGDAIIHHSLPLNYRPAARDLLRRENPLLSSHAGRLAPIFVDYQGVESPAILVNNRQGTPIYIDLFGPQTKTAHSLVCGSTGTGKSFAFNMLLMTMMAKYRPKIWLIDKGRSYESLCHALDGSYIELVQDEADDIKPTCMNPFYIPPADDGQHRKPTNEEIEFLCNWLIAAIKAGSDTATLHASTSALLTKALIVFYEDWPTEKEAMPSDFMEVLKDQNFSDLTGESLTDKLTMFYGKGIYAKLFDAPLEIEWDNDLIVLETERMANSRALPVAMLALFRQIEQYAKYRLPRSRRKVVGVDEAWNTIANKEAANALGGFYRELRKYKGGCMLISQSLLDFIKLVKQEGGAEDGILTNTSHYFLLACTDADYKAAVEHLNFSQEEIAVWDSIASLPPFFSEVFYRQRMKDDNYYSGVFRIYSAPVPLWIATTDADDVVQRDNLVGKYVKSGIPRSEARRRAIVELATAYPFGSRYQIDNEDIDNAA